MVGSNYPTEGAASTFEGLDSRESLYTAAQTYIVIIGIIRPVLIQMFFNCNMLIKPVIVCISVSLTVARPPIKRSAANSIWSKGADPGRVLGSLAA